MTSTLQELCSLVGTGQKTLPVNSIMALAGIRPSVYSAALGTAGSDHCLRGGLNDWLRGWLTGWLRGELTDWLRGGLTDWLMGGLSG